MKRISELRGLSHDHHHALVLARRCIQSTKPVATVPADIAWQNVRSAFPLHLEPHFVIEERYLLPSLEAIGESGLADRIRSEHRVLRLMAAVVSPSEMDIEHFGHLLDAHVRFEEREVFALAQSRFTPAMLVEIAKACKSMPRVYV